MCKLQKLITLGLIITLMATAGCAPVILRSHYEVGQQQKIRFSQADLYYSWVDQPGKEPAHQSGREYNENIILQREVESIDEDGAAIVKVTFVKVDISERRFTSKMDTLYKTFNG